MSLEFDCTKEKLSRKNVMEFLVQMIKSGKFKVDEKLHSENFVAKKLGVSRSTVHEVYTALEAMGIVECVHGGGTYLKSVTSDFTDSPLCLLMLLLETDSRQMVGFRKMIEIGIADVVVPKVKDEDIIEMKRALKNIEETSDYLFASKNDVLIHTIIVKLADNELISLVYNMAVTYITYISNNNWKKIILSDDEKLKKVQLLQHLNIIKSLEKRDTQLYKKYTLEHLEYIEHELMEL